MGQSHSQPRTDLNSQWTEIWDPFVMAVHLSYPDTFTYLPSAILEFSKYQLNIE
jgi:hypothetical protein